MLFPLVVLLNTLLPSGGIIVSCQQSSVLSSNRNHTQNEQWSIACADEWTADNLYHFIPRQTVYVTPACNSSGSYSPTVDVWTNNNKWLRTQTTTVPVVWICADPAKTFDSTFRVSASNVAQSLSFWTLVGIGISAGIFLGTVAYGIGAMSRVIDQQKGDYD